MTSVIRVLGVGAFASYFCLDALTTCIAVYAYGAGAESNPAMALALSTHGLVGFLALKLALSLIITTTAYLLAIRPDTRNTGVSALIAITTGGLLAAANNASALATGTSLFYGIAGGVAFIGPGALVMAAMLFTGLLAYTLMVIRDRQSGFYSESG